MKKAILFILLLACSFVAKAQHDPENLSGILIGVETRGSGISSSKDWKLNTMELDLTIGYGFNKRFSLYVPLTESVGLFSLAGAKTYEVATQLGAGIGYSPIHTSRYQLEIVAKVGSSLGGNWQFVYYDAGIRYGLSNSIYLGLGVRYYDSYKGNIGNHCNFYGAVGFRFNRYKTR